MAAPYPGATANVVCFKWSENHNLIFGETGITPNIDLSNKCAISIRRWAPWRGTLCGRYDGWDCGARGTLTAFALEADIAALLCKSDSEASWGHKDFASDVLTIRNHGVEIPLKVSELGRNVLSVVSIGEGPPRLVRGPKLMSAYSERASADKRPDSANGGLHLPLSSGGLYRSGLPQTFSACRAVTSSDARYGYPSGPKKIIVKLHVNREPASAQQLKRETADSDVENMHLFNYGHCEVWGVRTL